MVPLDHSESAMKSRLCVINIKRVERSKLLLSTEVPREKDGLIATDSLIEDLGTITTGDSILQKVKEDAQKWFNVIKQKSSANGIRLRTGLVISPIEIEDAIVNYAYRENVDLVVIGGGKSGLKERLLGFTTSRVATQIKGPILIVK